VAAYRTYEKGLGEVLASRRLDHYTAVCTAATASFAALSNLINAVEGSLRRPAHAGVAAAGAVAGIVRKVRPRGVKCRGGWPVYTPRAPAGTRAVP
jgi:anti-sigma factor RsiW